VLPAESALRREAPEALTAFLLRVGLRLALVAVIVQTTAHLTNEFLLDDRVQGLDADVEGTVFTWASSVATFAVALAAFLHAAAFEVHRRAFALLAAIALWFSLDDVAVVHERLALKLGEDVLHLPDYAAVRLWLVLYLPLLLLAGALLWQLANELGPQVGRALRLGLALLVASIPVEIVGLVTRRLAETGTEVPENFRVAAEEGLELAGWIVGAAALTAALCSALLRGAPPRERFVRH
jgi:hypothetical protein